MSMDERDDLPVLPPSLPPSLPASDPTGASPVDPVAGFDATAQADAEQWLAEQLATRNVPTAAPKPVDLGMPVAERSPSTRPDFTRPDLVPMGDATAVLLVGRALFVIAALLIGVAARRSVGTGGASRAEGFWPVVISAGVFTAVGLVGLIYWSAKLAENARRLKARSATPRAIVWSWLGVVGFVAFSCLTYLRVDVGGDLDPMPGVAAVGWLIVLAIAYGLLQGVFRGLSRTPPMLWFTAFPLDLVAFGLVWWRLTSWPTPAGGAEDVVRTTSNVAFGSAAALALNALVFVWLAQQGSNAIFQRLGRLEAQHRGVDPSSPDWFESGLAARPTVAGTPSVPRRPLISTRHLATVVAVFHMLWGLGVVIFSVLVALIAFEYSGAPLFLGDELLLAGADTDRLALVGTIVGVVYMAAIVTHGVWAVLAAINGRRVTVHSPNPGTFVIAFAPMPLLVVAGLLIGGRLGYWLVVAGLAIAFFALILVNQMLMALAARQGATVSGFSRWSTCLVLVYLGGFAMNFLYAQGAAQAGLYATISLVQGILISVGGYIGFGAMRDLESSLRMPRRIERAESPASAHGADLNLTVPPPGTA